MKLYVLEKTNGAVECIGVITKDLSALKKMMNFKTTGVVKFETFPNEEFEEYNREQARKYSWPYEPFIEKYKLIFECSVSDDLKECCVFRVEE